MIRKIIILASVLQAFNQKEALQNISDDKLAKANPNIDLSKNMKNNLTLVIQKEQNLSKAELNISKVLSKNQSFQQQVKVNTTILSKKALNVSQTKNKNDSGWQVSKWGEGTWTSGKDEWKQEESFDGEFDVKQPSKTPISKNQTRSTIKGDNNASKISNSKNNSLKDLKIKVKKIEIKKEIKKDKIKPKKAEISKKIQGQTQKIIRVDLKKEVSQNKRNYSRQPPASQKNVSKNLTKKSSSNATKNLTKSFIPIKTFDTKKNQSKKQISKGKNVSKINKTKKSQKIQKVQNKSKKANKKKQRKQKKQKIAVKKNVQKKQIVKKKNKPVKIEIKQINEESYIPVKILQNEEKENKRKKQIKSPVLPSNLKLKNIKSIQSTNKTTNQKKVIKSAKVASKQVKVAKVEKGGFIPVKNQYKDEQTPVKIVKKDQDKKSQLKKLSNQKRKKNKNVKKQKKLNRKIKKQKKNSKKQNKQNNKQKKQNKKSSKNKQISKKKAIDQKISKQKKLLKYVRHDEPVPVKNPFQRPVIKERKKVVQPDPNQYIPPKNLQKQKSQIKKNKLKKVKSLLKKEDSIIKKQERVPIKTFDIPSQTDKKKTDSVAKKEIIIPKSQKAKPIQKTISQNKKKSVSNKKNFGFVPIKGASKIVIPVKDQKPNISKPVERIEVLNYVPSKNEGAEIIKINGALYIPVVRSYENVQSKIFQFKQKTYIPKLNQKVIIIAGKKYMPVTLLKTEQPNKQSKNVTKPLKNEKKQSQEIPSKEQQQFVPIKNFESGVKLNTSVSIKVNDNYFVPIRNKKVKTVVIDGTHYVPVKQVDETIKIKNSIQTKTKGFVNVIKINGKTYIPISIIPKKYRQVFRNKMATKTHKKNNKKPVASVKKAKNLIPVKNQQPNVTQSEGKPQKAKTVNYIPVNDPSAEPIKIDGKIYIPVVKSPQNKLVKIFNINGKKYIPLKHKNVIIIGGRKYLPVALIKSKKQHKNVKVNNKIKISKKKSSISKKTYVPIKNFNASKNQNSKKNAETQNPIMVKNLRNSSNSDKINSQNKYLKSWRKAKSGKYDPVPIKGFKLKPIQIDGKTLEIQSPQPLKLGGNIYIPFTLKSSNSEAKQFKLKNLEIKKNKAIKINGVHYKTSKHTPVVIIGNSYYIPVRILTTPLIKISGKKYIPLKNNHTRPIVVQGKTYIPIQEANEEQIESSIPITHKKQKKIVTVKIGKITYIPINVIPQQYQPKYKQQRKYKEKKVANQAKLVIKVNGQHFVPITNRTMKVIKFENVKYIPVYKAPQNKINKLKTVTPLKSGKTNIITIDNVTYIPLHVVPYEHRRAFKPKKRVFPSSKPVIKINNVHYVPVNHKKMKPIEVEGIVYIPVHQANPTQIQKSKKIYPKHEGHVETIKIGGQTYIPLHVIPKIYAPIFKKQIISVNKNKRPTHVISINNQEYIPHKSVKPIEFNGVKYYPVKEAPESIVDELRPIKPNKKGKISTLKVQNITYIPAGVIPKEFTKVFKPVVKKQRIVMLIKGNQYVPIHDKNVQPITIKGKKYIPVKIATQEQIHNSKVLASKTQHNVQKIKLGKQTYTYIPVEFLPKKYRYISKKKLKVPNYPTHQIQINSQKFVPITNRTVKPIVLNGVKYIPLYTAPKKNSEYLEKVEPVSDKNVNVIKISNIHYIPESVIPKEYIKQFQPVKKIIRKPNPVIQIENNNYIPSQNKKLKPIKVKGVTYIPVQRTNTQQTHQEKEISIKAKGKVRLVKFGNEYYLPIKAIPKVFRKSFKRNLSIKKKEIENFPTHVIKVNNIDYVPVTNKALKPVDFNGIKYIPVYTAPKDKIHLLQPVRPAKTGEIQTLNLQNITYIPANVIPKAFKKVFKPAKYDMKKLKHVIKLNNGHYVPVQDKNVKPIVIDGVKYIPVMKVANNSIKKAALKITPRENGNINSIEVGKYTYIPQNVIPKVFQSVFYNHTKQEVKKIPNYPSVQIKINGASFVPITNKTVKPLELDGVKYIPVYSAPKENIDYLESVSPAVSGKVETLKIQDTQYIPVDVLPKEQIKNFEPVKQIVTQPKPVIKIEDSNFVPIQDQKLAPLSIQGVTYIPVLEQKDNKHNLQKQTTINAKGNIKVVKIGNTSYLPQNSIPKKYRPLFKKNLIKQKKEIPNIATHSIKINDISFVPITNKVVAPVTFNGIKYIPVYKAPEEKIPQLKAVKPIKEGFIKTLNLENITYIPVDVIPKEERKEFKPVKHVVSSPYPVIEINNKFYISEQSAHTIDINGITYIPIKQAKYQQVISSKTITPTNKDNLKQVKFGEYTYIPIKQIPKAFRQILIKKTATEEVIANKPTHTIKVNNQNFVPITNKYVKPISYKGVKYIPVYLAPSDTKSLKSVSSTQQGNIETIKLGNVVYIPAKVVPKEFIKVFKPKKTLLVFNPVIKINDQHFVPTKGKDAKPIQVDGQTYIPVQQASKASVKTRKIVQVQNDKQTQIIVIGQKSYIPLNSIPKVFRSLMKKRSESGKKQFKVSPQEASEFEKYYYAQPVKKTKIATKKILPSKQVKKVQSVPTVKKEKKEQKIKKVKKVPKAQNKVKNTVKKSLKSQKKIVKPSAAKKQSTPTNIKKVEIINITKEIEQLEANINRKDAKQNLTVPIIRKSQFTIFKMASLTSIENQNISTLSKIESSLINQNQAEKFNSSLQLPQSCNCNLNKINNSLQTCLCGGQNANVKISMSANQQSNQSSIIPLSIIISANNTQNIKAQVNANQSSSLKLQMNAPISHQIDSKQIINPQNTQNCKNLTI